MDSTCLGFVLVLVLVALVVQVVLIGTRWWGSFVQNRQFGASNQTMRVKKTLLGLFTVNIDGVNVKTDSGKARLAQTLSAVSLAMAIVAALLVICLVAHKRTPSCAMRTGTAVVALMTFAVSLSASIFATRYVKAAANARYGVALPLHYVSSLMLLAVAVLLLFKTKGPYDHTSLTNSPVHAPMTS